MVATAEVSSGIVGPFFLAEVRGVSGIGGGGVLGREGVGEPVLNEEVGGGAGCSMGDRRWRRRQTNDGRKEGVDTRQRRKIV
jgi:hypothetical protein